MEKIRLAGCIILDKRGEFLLIHRNTSKRVQWEIPGGKINNNEIAEQAATRELAEELGVKVKVIRELGRKDFAEDGYFMEYIWFLAEVLDGEPRLMEKEKYDNLRYFSWNNAKAMISELSPNTKNLVSAYFAKELKL